MRMLLRWGYLCNCQGVIVHGETDVAAGEGQPINPDRITLVGWAGVVGQHTQQRLTLIMWNPIQQIIWEIHMQKEISGVIGKPADGFWVGIAIGDIGLNIKDWGSVHQVCAANVEHSPEFRRILDTQQPNAG